MFESIELEKWATPLESAIRGTIRIGVCSSLSSGMSTTYDSVSATTTVIETVGGVTRVRTTQPITFELPIGATPNIIDFVKTGDEDSILRIGYVNTQDFTTLPGAITIAELTFPIELEVI